MAAPAGRSAGGGGGGGSVSVGGGLLVAVAVAVGVGLLVGVIVSCGVAVGVGDGVAVVVGGVVGVEVGVLTGVSVGVAVEVGVSYAAPPNHVKSVIAEALANVPLALAVPPPDVILVDFASSSVLYRARCFIADMERASLAQDQMRSAIWYALQRHGLEIPFPIQVEYSPATMPAVAYPEQADLPALLGNSALFSGL